MLESRSFSDVHKLIARLDRIYTSEMAATQINTSDASHLSNLRVLQVLDNLGMGGAEIWSMEVLRFWHRNGSNRPRD